jgi:hypothetical protein
MDAVPQPEVRGGSLACFVDLGLEGHESQLEVITLWDFPRLPREEGE